MKPCSFHLLASLQIIWQIFDIIVHIAVDMVELLRVAGNVIIMIVSAISIYWNVTMLKLEDVAYEKKRPFISMIVAYVIYFILFAIWIPVDKVYEYDSPVWVVFLLVTSLLFIIYARSNKLVFCEYSISNMAFHSGQPVETILYMMLISMFCAHPPPFLKFQGGGFFSFGLAKNGSSVSYS